ncbi:hypothetical protein Q4Q39_05725 [Flavivirga amylovorans]|uniref:DUF2116 family Zn-ribbon domain-containing protein n=1 Tax=Flavivirga amylovorans TaxID=870486 RepID=A0ABT8WZI0_9FLAO|nr:hypothetical protein [Flavivirga amylovorans]MDO5986902.1 hypothetical protein [Flavivirga amylovorans]
MQHKFCLSCSKELIGRTDKKFCDSHCRATFHNKNKPPHEYYIIEINGILRKNRSILSSLSPEGKTTVRTSLIKSMGFSFNYFTNVFKTKTGTYYLCYDYGYLLLNDKGQEKILIIKKQDYM